MVENSVNTRINEDIDDISVVQKVVALFMSNTNEEAKEKIRQIVTEL